MTSVAAAAADRSAITELEGLLRSADPTQSGLLSYSEFAYLILRSGGSQEQVDALIGQFAVRTRADRVVCYEALLAQLRDALPPQQQPSDAVQEEKEKVVDEELSSNKSNRVNTFYTAPHKSTSIRAPHDTDHPLSQTAAAVLDHSPPPVPPPSSSSFLFSSTAESTAAPAVSTRFARPSSLFASSSVSARSSISPPEEGKRKSMSLSSPMARSVTGAGGRDGFFSSSLPRTSASRSASVVSYNEDRVSSARAASEPSARFIETALYAAQREGSVRSRRSTAATAAVSPARTRSASQYSWNREDAALKNPSRHDPEWPSRLSLIHQPVKSADTSEALRHSRSNDPLSPSPTREESITRMTQAALQASSPVRRGGNVVSQRFGDSSRSITADSQRRRKATTAGGRNKENMPHMFSSSDISEPRLATRSSTASSSFYTHSTSTASRLLSLCDVFFGHLLPRARQMNAPLALNDEEAIRLSDLEEIFAEKQVGVHPLTLEAVVDSLGSSRSHSSVGDRRSFMTSVRRERSSAVGEVSAAAEDVDTTITGGADSWLSFMDFCVIVSRLRPSTILQLRSPTTWSHRQSPKLENKKRCTPVEVVAGKHGSARASSRDRPGTYRLRESRKTEKTDSNSNSTASSSTTETGEADVTVSPMTPESTCPTPHHSRACRTTSPMRNADGRLGSARQPLALRSRSLYDNVEDSPPTARQLSVDRQFSLREEKAGTQTRYKKSSFPTHRTASSRNASSRSPQTVQVSIRSPQQQQNQHQSPLSSTVTVFSASPASPPSSYRRLHPPSPIQQVSRRILFSLQAASATLLRRCTQIDDQQTGCIAAGAWSSVLRGCCPTLQPEERKQAEAWVRALGRQHRGPHGDVYAHVLEDILTASTTRDRDGAGSEESPFSQTSSASPVSVPSASSIATTNTAPPHRGEKVHSASAVNAASELREAFLSACGGDTAALSAYLHAFDEANRGYLDAHVWRASLEELFRRTTDRRCPTWVLKASLQLARAPLLDTSTRQDGARGSRSDAALAAQARARRVPAQQRGEVCDYRYVLEELGLSSP